MAATPFDKQRKPIGECRAAAERIAVWDLCTTSAPFVVSFLLANRRDVDRGGGDRTGARAISHNLNRLFGREIEAMLPDQGAFVAESAARTAGGVFRR